MKHDDIRHKLSEYLDDAVSPEERGAIEEHLGTCTECSDALRELRRTIEHIRSVEEIDPPAWMSGKIMAAVREETERRRSLFRRIFFPLAVKIPLQTAAVLFVAVTAYYIYNQAHPVRIIAKAPMEQSAGSEAPSDKVQRSRGLAGKAVPRTETEAPQKPGYRSLDMKYAYEQPSAPEPEKRTLPKNEHAAGAAIEQKERAASNLTAAPLAAAGAPSAPARKEKKLEEATGAAALADKDQETAAQRTIVEHFMKHDLPERMKTKGLTVTFSRVPSHWPELQRIGESGRQKIRNCRLPYLVSAHAGQQEQRYVYCFDENSVVLLGKYAVAGNHWIEIE